MRKLIVDNKFGVCGALTIQVVYFQHWLEKETTMRSPN
jgi:hypothetical protein